VSQIQETVTSLVDLQGELAAAKQWRSEQEEYEKLAGELSALPARPVTEATIASLAQGEKAAIATRTQLLSELVSKRSKHLLLSVAFEQLRAEWNAAELAEANASRSTRAAADAALEAERRRAEEEALAYAAAVEAKASAEEEAEEEEGEEKKPDMGGTEGEREEGEEGAIDEPSAAASSMDAANGMPSVAEEEGAIPAATKESPAAESGMQDAPPALSAGVLTPVDSPAPSPTPAPDTAAPMET
jgi:hypothetical protein